MAGMTKAWKQKGVQPGTVSFSSVHGICKDPPSLMIDGDQSAVSLDDSFSRLSATKARWWESTIHVMTEESRVAGTSISGSMGRASGIRQGQRLNYLGGPSSCHRGINIGCLFRCRTRASSESLSIPAKLILISQKQLITRNHRLS